MKTPEIISSEVAVSNKWTTIKRERLRYENGAQGEYLIVERQPALMIMPVIKEGNEFYTYMVKQYRHPIGRKVWQFPMGTLEENKDPLSHARDELREETGLLATDLILVGEFFVDPGLSRQKCIAYIAEGITEGGEQDLEETEAGMEAKRISLSEIELMIQNGDIVDSWGYSGLYLLSTYLKSR